MREKFPKTKFDKLFQDQGGLLDLEGLKPPIQTIIKSEIDWIQTIPIKFKDTNFYIAFTNGLTFEARVEENDDYFIGINFGILGVIFNIFICLLSNPKILPDIGNINADPDFNLTYPDGFPMHIPKLDTIANSINSNTFVYEKFSYDETRRLYTFILGTMALRFLIFHEISHIAAGHIGFWKNRMNEEYFSEFIANTNNNSSIRLKHVIEYHADACAALLFYNFLKSSVWYELKSLGMNKLAHNDPLTIRLCTIAVGVLFHCFEQVALQYGQNLHHPPADVRFNTVIKTFCGLAEGENKNFGNLVRKTVVSTAAELDLIRKTLELPWNNLYEQNLNKIFSDIDALAVESEKLLVHLRKYRKTE